MKKALLSLLLVAAFMPFALAQVNDPRTINYTDVSACESYTWAVNNQTYTTDTIVTYVNSTDDIIYVLDLTINTPFTSNQLVNSNHCTFTWRGNTYDASGSYSDTVVASASSGLCDSVFNLSLTVSSVEYDTIEVSACGSYTWNDSTYTTSGNHIHTTTTANCTHNDVLALQIVSSLNVSENVQNCGDYSWYGETYTQSGVYTHTVTDTAASCDTIHQLNLNIVVNVADTTSDEACASRTWRGQTFTATGIYTVSDTNATTHCVTLYPLSLTIKAPRANTKDTAMTGCNSIMFNVSSRGGNTTRIFRESTVWDTLFFDHSMSRCYDSTINLTVTINKSGYDTTWVNSCDSFYWSLNKKTYYTTPTTNPRFSSGTDANGCDSVHVLSLNISNSPVISAINGEWHLNAGETAKLYPTCTSGSSYKWTYGNGQTSTADTLIIPNVQGNIDVALEATLNYPANNIQCKDTSWITIVTFVGIDGVENTQVNLYPNPTVGQLNIQSQEAVREVVIFNSLGQKVTVKQNLGTQSAMNLSNLSKGTYTMRLTLQNGETITRKFIISK